jgi:hypothetical protein
MSSGTATITSYYDDATMTRVELPYTVDLTKYAPIDNPTFTTKITTPEVIVSSEIASTIASFDGSKKVKSLDTATYPNLTELSYVKGLASSVQTQLNNKVNSNTAISAGTGTKVTYDAKGLVLSSENAKTTDIDVTIQTVASNATVTPVVANDIVRITALATGVTIANMTAPTDGKVLFVEIKDNGTSRTVAFGTDYVFHVTAITATTISKWLTFGMIYNGNTSKWHILSATSQV